MASAGHLVLVNPSAGGGRAAKVLPELERALSARGLKYRLVLTTSLEHGCEEARAAAAAGEIPVVMSGDGLIGQVGGVLAGGEAPMGVIPGGRGNDLARVLGIPTEVTGAVDVLAAGSTRTIDVGEINGRRFLGIASCGFDSEANRIANQARLVKGNLVYLYAALRALAAWKPARFELILDGDPLQFTGYSVAAANSKAFGGGMFVAPDAELDDGRLDVVWISDVAKLRYLANLRKVFKGRHVDNEEVSVLRAAEVSISADRPFAVYADGDHVADLPATIRLLPRALNVIAPPR
ncbi:MAG: diacylglycerol kinase [Actinobacteria bacterium 13_1_20CM_3_68_9]|jgi:YegS/Rv2252/BmrU family lipid kinase|nr:MAG: diacylglycerol kinase [Actinobacteria bacterium 13_1_20CM_3_68_9]